MGEVFRGDKEVGHIDTYIKAHMEQHQALDNMMAYGYVGIDPDSKVCNC